MSIVDDQRLLTRLLTDSRMLEAFAIDPVSTATSQGYPAESAARLTRIPHEQLRDSASSLIRKRAGAVGRILPFTRRAIGSDFGRLFREHSETFVPEGVERHLVDASAFARFLRNRTPADWMIDLAAWESTTASFRSSNRRVVFIRLHHRPADLIAAVADRVAPKRRPTIAIGFRMGAEGRIHWRRSPLPTWFNLRFAGGPLPADASGATLEPGRIHTRRGLIMRRLFIIALLCLPFFRSSTALAEDRPDLVAADFEGDDYGDWKVEGDAFGTKPARGTLPGQMAVTGFLGRGLANSFEGGDDSTGTLTSPAFRIERKYLNFLIGGGSYAGETCVNLIVDGEVVRTATGPNSSAGGVEALDWFSWETADLGGRTASLRIVDRRKGGWGHINVDQIVQSDVKRGSGIVERKLAKAGRFLRIPVRGDAPTRRVKVEAGGRWVEEFEVKLAEGEPDFFTFLDLQDRQEDEVRISAILPPESKALAGFERSPEALDSTETYRERLRPGFHFTSRRGWLNDPNGLVYFNDEYHLFYQHNPYGWEWGNMHWGHAVSPDLIHWSELPEALSPVSPDDWCFSGSAVVDVGNTSGFGVNGIPPLVGAYTSTGRGECIVYSNDRGRTWSEFEGNPVLRHQGRDPRLLRHEPTKQWIMAVYDETDGRRDIVFLSSKDLKTWTRESVVEGFYECPGPV